MKLYYFSAPQGNVGDDLNQWLWSKVLAPGVLNNDEQHLLIGIGTLLNHKIPPAQKYTVLTSGVGYGELPNLSCGDWNYVGLRGELTKKALQVTQPVCLLDGAYLMPRFFKPEATKKYKVAYIPHVDSMINGEWSKVCELAGIKLLDPRWGVEKFIEELCSCDKVLTEAMHGAILADAYGVPWSPIKAYEYISEFKWDDWATSLDIDYMFTTISSTWKGDRGKSIMRRAINTVKRLCENGGYFPNNWTPVQPCGSTQEHLEKAADQIINIIKSDNYYLSNDTLKKNRTDLLLEVISCSFK